MGVYQPVIKVVVFNKWISHFVAVFVNQCGWNFCRTFGLVHLFEERQLQRGRKKQHYARLTVGARIPVDGHYMCFAGSEVAYAATRAWGWDHGFLEVVTTSNKQTVVESGEQCYRVRQEEHGLSNIWWHHWSPYTEPFTMTTRTSQQLRFASVHSEALAGTIGTPGLAWRPTPKPCMVIGKKWQGCVVVPKEELPRSTCQGTVVAWSDAISFRQGRKHRKSAEIEGAVQERRDPDEFIHNSLLNGADLVSQWLGSMIYSSGWRALAIFTLLKPIGKWTNPDVSNHLFMASGWITAMWISVAQPLPGQLFEAAMNLTLVVITAFILSAIATSKDGSISRHKKENQLVHHLNV